MYLVSGTPQPQQIPLQPPHLLPFGACPTRSRAEHESRTPCTPPKKPMLSVMRGLDISHPYSISGQSTGEQSAPPYGVDGRTKKGGPRRMCCAAPYHAIYTYL